MERNDFIRLPETLDICERDGVPFLVFKEFAALQGVVHGMSTRKGGVSTGVWESMNLSFTRGDNQAQVHENFRRFCRALTVQPENVVLGHQTHSLNVRAVTEQDRGKGLFREREYTDVDALITNQTDVVLDIMTADCASVYFVDPVQRAVGIAHAGWRGTVGRIVGKTIGALEQEYGCLPKNIWVGVGPCICKECYEIGSEVAEKCMEAFPEPVWKKFLEPSNLLGKYHLSLVEANMEITAQSGVLREHIVDGSVCTFCNPQMFFSHRRTGEQRGNAAGFIGLRPE